MTTANMTNSPQGCTPEQPWRVVTGLTHLYLKGPEFTVTLKRYMNEEDDTEALASVGKVAASLNVNQALVEALTLCANELEALGIGLSNRALTDARAALALTRGGNK